MERKKFDIHQYDGRLQRFIPYALGVVGTLGLFAGMDTDPQVIEKDNSTVVQPLEKNTPVSIRTVKEPKPSVLKKVITPTSSPIVESSNYDLINQLKAMRNPDGRRNDELENGIAIEVLKDVHPTKEGYENFKQNIHREYLGVFERAGTTPKLIRNIIPRYFIFHHTAHIYDQADNTKQFVDGMIKAGNSVQWFIDRNAIVHQFTSNPLSPANHARPFLNIQSAGVETETWPNKFQGDVTARQYEQDIYVGTYQTTELWHMPKRQALGAMAGHNDLDALFNYKDRNRKPDFQNQLMRHFYPKIEELLKQLSGDPSPIPLIIPKPLILIP